MRVYSFSSCVVTGHHAFLSVTTRPTDDSLTARALTGDARAWGELVKRHDRAVRLALIARGIAPDEARA